jgi:alkylation response protein AidB-like acyl-CoA dehydrogenase
MDFTLSDEQKMLVDGARRYLRERYNLEGRRAAARSDDGFSRQHWERFAEFGWLALPVAEDAGGMGGSPADLSLLMEQLGAALVAEPVLDSAVLCGALLARADDSPLAASVLGEIAAGTAIAALAHVEQEGRCEYDTPVATCAAVAADGWKLFGIKHRVFHGASADRILLTARLDGGAELGLFVIDRETAGLKINAYEVIDGTRAADIRLEAVRVPASALVLRGAAVSAALEHACDRAVLAMSAAAVGSMDAVMAMTSEYLKTRVQYGKPLAQFQALQHRMAEMFIETDQARSIVYHALACIDDGSTEDVRRAISAVKSLVARACRFVAGQGIQLHGGIGTTEEYAVGHHYRAMLVYEYRFGDSSFHLDRSAALSPRRAA